MNKENRYKIQYFQDSERFAVKAKYFLLKHEIQNVLLFSITNSLLKNKNAYGSEDPMLIIVETHGKPVLIAIQTPPHNLLLSYTDDDASIDFLAETLATQHSQLPGILGYKGGVSRFIAIWKIKTGKSTRLTMKERIHRLDQVNPKYLNLFTVKPVKEDDFPLILDWKQRFIDEALENEPITEESRNRLMQAIRKQKIFALYHEGKIRSITQMAGKTPHGNFVNLVYTPPEYRKQGYATACVAEVSQKILQNGNDYCCLFTDLANPTSNHIYHLIGFKPIMDVNQFQFE